MEILDQAISKLQGIKDSLPDLINEVVNESHAEIEDKIIFQLRQGIKGDGSFLPNYSPRSVSEFGKPAGPIKLYDQGDYYQGITAKAVAGFLEIDDTDWKDAMLTQRYGLDIRQLTDQSVEELKEETFIPRLIDKVQTRLAT